MLNKEGGRWFGHSMTSSVSISAVFFSMAVTPQNVVEESSIALSMSGRVSGAARKR
jgi:uncharacterized protein YcsI (UPF0317 family)